MLMFNLAEDVIWCVDSYHKHRIDIDCTAGLSRDDVIASWCPNVSGDSHIVIWAYKSSSSDEVLLKNIVD